MTDLDTEPTSTHTPEERALTGREACDRLPRARLAEWAPAADRPDPVELLLADEGDRIPELLPLRHERMAASPFAFYRGSAIIFAADAASRPDTGLRAQLCGDAHLANFGGYATPERELVFDLNDFDETCPGPFEWDLSRLAASFEVGGRANGLDQASRALAVQAVATGYCSRMAELGRMGNLELVAARMLVSDAGAEVKATASRDAMRRFRDNVRKTRSRNRMKALAKLTEVVDGELRFLSDPPILVRIHELFEDDLAELVRQHVGAALDGYRESLSPDRRALMDRYRLVDVARKVVGVGSVGTRCWVALFVGRDQLDPLFLQVKEAGPSVLEAYAGASRYENHGQRVVEGQRLQQSATDILLGWTRVADREGRSHDYYVRQLWDQKGSAALDQLDADSMRAYAQICGQTLARSHARSGDPIAISAYLGGGKSTGRALVEFSRVYADQNEADHARFVAHLGSDGTLQG